MAQVTLQLTNFFLQRGVYRLSQAKNWSIQDQGKDSREKDSVQTILNLKTHLRNLKKKVRAQLRVAPGLFFGFI